MKTKLTFLALAVLLTPPAFGQFQYERLKSFGAAEQTGNWPTGIIEGSDGALYGTTAQAGGSNVYGTLFKLNKDGGGYEVLHSFASYGTDGSYPAGLVEGSGGALYGTTFLGGSNNAGTVFKLNKDGSDYTLLYGFASADGHSPGTSALVEGGDGALYGTTQNGGITNADDWDGLGTVFKLNKDGSGYTVLHNFTGNPGDGNHPVAALVEGIEGVLYGTTFSGGKGSNDVGTVFKLNRDGSGYVALHSFTDADGDGKYPFAAVMEGTDGALYGTTARYFNGAQNGGGYYGGTVFKLNKDGSGYAVLHEFAGTNADGGLLMAPLQEGYDGALYGTTAEYRTCNRGPCDVFGTLFRLNKDGSYFSVLHTFKGASGDGRDPRGALFEGSDGSLYGATAAGGEMGFGTIFVLRPQPVVLSPILSTDGVIVRFTSVARSTNRLQRATALDGSWLTLTNLVASTNGVADFTDTAPPQPSAFYRVVRVP